MKDIEKKLYAYYKEQTENAPVICCTDNKRIVKIQSKRWIKVAVCAVLVLAIGIGFIGTDYQSFFKQPDLPPDNIIDAPSEETENITNDDTPEINNSKEPEASEVIKEPSTDNSREPEQSQGITSTLDNSIDTPTEPDISTDAPPETSTDIPYEPKIVYAEEYSFGSGGDMVIEADDLLPWYSDNPQYGLWKRVFDNPKDIYYVCLKPSCIEYDCYDSIYYTKTTRINEIYKTEEVVFLFNPPTFKEWKENTEWMIEKDLETFRRFGIEAKPLYYGFDWTGLVNDSQGLIPRHYYPELKDDLIGYFDYFFTAYASGEDLINYAKTVTEELAKANDKLYKLAAEKFYEKHGYEIDDISDLSIPYAELYGAYYRVEEDSYSPLSPKEISDMILTKWDEYTAKGLRPQSPCGGIIFQLPKWDEKKLIYEYYLSSFDSIA